ncbi:hypothetical protein HanIR_Chr02g0053421 [Helianthus annuus]|nr:hypothetical protein HanIR_Chr02g0053421 [Helianthus annuus]
MFAVFKNGKGKDLAGQPGPTKFVMIFNKESTVLTCYPTCPTHLGLGCLLYETGQSKR